MKASWQKQVIASSGYRELGMFEDTAKALEQIEPEDKTRNEVLYSRVDIYLADFCLSGCFSKPLAVV